MMNMRRIVICIYVLLLHITTFGRQVADTSYNESDIHLETDSGTIAGTLTLPDKSTGIPVALIIAGSGPTDRNGNSAFTRNDALKFLAHALADNGIASVRFDKRGIGGSAKAGMKEADLRFETYINDAAGWISLLKKDKRFSKVVVIGHSEGSLIGMVAAANAGADQFVSIAGTGRPIDEVLKEQLKVASEELYQLSIPVLDSLKQGHLVNKVDGRLFTLFRPSVQPYMISWLRYNPQEAIKKLSIPVLIVQGTNDIQVPVLDAEKLAAAKPAAKLLIIQDMNHVLKIVSGDRQANMATYQDPSLPLAEQLVTGIVSFVKD
jgi:pimeloyl-ACP methyl ester carboxylesterase